MAVSITRTTPPTTPVGFTATADNGFDKCYNEESGTPVDRTTEFITVGSDVDSFASQNDYVYFSQEVNRNGSSGTESRITKLHIKLSTNASQSIEPVFEYSTGDNTWATLDVTDGTNGFTQDGTIVITPSTFPSNSAWAVNSRDGSGNEIGDSTDRRYLRIKRGGATLATPPKISESGVGYLTPSTTYYYRASSTKAGYGSARAAYLRSEATSEVSATTTDVKCSVKLEWDVDAVSPHRLIWRTATSGSYGGAGLREVRADLIDTYCQLVGSYRAYNYIFSYSETQNYGYDNGLPVNFRYSSSYTLFAYHLNYPFRAYSCGDIYVSGGTSGDTPSFADIVAEDKTQGWDTFIETTQGLDDDNQVGLEIYTCHDNLIIDDYFYDDWFLFITNNEITIESTATVQFGYRDSYGKLYGGGTFWLIGHYASVYYWNFYNTKFYGTTFKQSGYFSGQTFNRFPYIHDNCELYSVRIEGQGGLQEPQIDGANITVDGLDLYNARYGFNVDEDSFATSTFSNVTIHGGTALYGTTWKTEGLDVVFRDFVFNAIGGLCIAYGFAPDYQINLHLVNPTFNTAQGDTTISDLSYIGLTWVIYEEYELNLKIIDSNADPVFGASVMIRDVNGNEIDNSPFITDVNGEIEQQNIAYKMYEAGTLVSETYRHYLADDVTMNSPFTVTISKSGYQTKVVKYELDDKMVQVETLEVPETGTRLLDTTLYDSTIY